MNRGHVLVGSVCAQHIAESTAPGGTVDVVPIKTRISDPDVQSTQRVCPCARGMSVRDRVARSPVSLSVHAWRGYRSRVAEKAKSNISDPARTATAHTRDVREMSSQERPRRLTLRFPSSDGGGTYTRSHWVLA